MSGKPLVWTLAGGGTWICMEDCIIMPQAELYNRQGGGRHTDSTQKALGDGTLGLDLATARLQRALEKLGFQICAMPLAVQSMMLQHAVGAMPLSFPGHVLLNLVRYPATRQ